MLAEPASLCTSYLTTILLQHLVCQAGQGCVLSCSSSLQTVGVLAAGPASMLDKVHPSCIQQLVDLK